MLVTAGLEEVLQLPEHRDITTDLLDAILDEAEKFAGNILLPLQMIGDRQGAALQGVTVTMPDGFVDAYRDFISSGWNTLTAPKTYGGQHLPWMIASAVNELFHGANSAFALCPLLTQAGIELLHAHGSETLRHYYLPKLVQGDWTATMCLTEPQAGSNVGAVSATAEPDEADEADAYHISGQKIFISYGEHNLTENIVHFVLARLPGAPKGTAGLSLFLVPKRLPDGQHNRVACLSLEHKMGLHASPTCVMQFDRAEGWLVGDAHGGIKAMFTMMNNARLGVGIQALGIAGRACHMAQAFAQERIQGDKSRPKATINQYGDVQVMLQTLQAHMQSLRGLCYYTAAWLDKAHHAKEHQQRLDFLIPIAKAHTTDVAFEMTSLAMQVYGGMGYVEESGIAQLMRDVRVTMLYEGTNGIQAMDLLTRKLVRDEGTVAWELCEEIRHFAKNIQGLRNPQKAMLRNQLLQAAHGMEELSECMLSAMAAKNDKADRCARDYTRCWGYSLQAWLLAKWALANPDNQKLKLACFFASRILPAAEGLRIGMMLELQSDSSK